MVAPNREVIDLQFKTMNERVDKIDQNIERISNKLDKMSENFASKEDHNKNAEAITRIDWVVSWINLKIASVSGGMAVLIFLIEKLWR